VRPWARSSDFWGPNGAGKTNQLRMLAPLIAAQRRDTARVAGATCKTPGRRIRERNRLNVATRPGGSDTEITAGVSLVFSRRRALRTCPLERGPQNRDAEADHDARAGDLRHGPRGEGDLLPVSQKKKRRFLTLGSVSGSHGPQFLFSDEPTTGLGPQRSVGRESGDPQWTHATDREAPRVFSGDQPNYLDGGGGARWLCGPNRDHRLRKDRGRGEKPGEELEAAPFRGWR